MTRKLNFFVYFFVPPKSCRLNKSPWPYPPSLWSTLALSFTDLIACDEFLIQAHIDLHIAHSKWPMRDLLKAIDYLRGPDSNFYPPPFIWRSVTVQMGVIFQLYRVLSPQQASNIESAFRKKKRKGKTLWVQSQALFFFFFFRGLKYAMWTQEVFYQTPNW